MSTVYASGSFAGCLCWNGFADNCSALSRACSLLSQSDICFKETAAEWLDGIGFVANVLRPWAGTMDIYIDYWEYA
jgi:hypothetical protein